MYVRFQAQLKVLRVQKIENDWLWSKFRSEVDLMRDHGRAKGKGIVVVVYSPSSCS